MKTKAVSGPGLMASAAICLIGSLTESASAEVMWSAGAWLAVVVSAIAYRDIARHARRVPSAVALALLGFVASAWTVEATLRVAGQPWITAHPGPLFAVVGVAAIGNAQLAYAAGRAELVHPATGMIIAIAALLSTLTADPGAPYLLGAGPLGAVLLARAIRSRMSKGRTT
ncbi:hypothetical protein GCM10023194_58160 [Planotetraspora phitsanulokensis]|uniref:Uncharacterized protein n=1 Tax=Planotetraspora phitsanulokensis TaxID=575192 RepID=A0A8J3XGM7_9ACTN|nr:hypothetical protein [Planotetraspora phitsanulokensis]GII40279.1 hypothetical protein Pph01_52820 [Planotetraspora phitsanulokensis]